MVLHKKAKPSYSDCENISSRSSEEFIENETYEEACALMPNQYDRGINQDEKCEGACAPASIQYDRETNHLQSDKTIEGACALVPQQINHLQGDKTISVLHKAMQQQVLNSQGFMEASNFERDEIEDEMLNPNLAVAHYDPLDERRVCKFLNSKGGCWKGDNCKFSHQPLDPDGWTTDKMPTFYDAFNYLDYPDPGLTAKVKVKCIKDLRTFYVHIKSYPDKYNPVYSKYYKHISINTK